MCTIILLGIFSTVYVDENLEKMTTLGKKILFYGTVKIHRRLQITSEQFKKNELFFGELRDFHQLKFF